MLASLRDLLLVASLPKDSVLSIMASNINIAWPSLDLATNLPRSPIAAPSEAYVPTAHAWSDVLKNWPAIASSPTRKW